MKTIISILEVIMYNVLPATLVTPVIIFIKNIIPLIGVASIRIGLHLMISLQKIHNIVLHKLQLVKFHDVDDDPEIAYNNIKRSHTRFKGFPFIRE